MRLIILDTSPLACISRAAQNIPRLVRRACSPSAYLLRSPLPKATTAAQPPQMSLAAPPNSPETVRFSTRLCAAEAQENTPPVTIGRAAVLLEDVTPVLERYGAPAKPQSIAAPVTRLSTRSPRGLRSRTVSVSSFSAGTPTSSTRKRKNSSLDSSTSDPFLTTSVEYFQNHFYEKEIESDQILIEGSLLVSKTITCYFVRKYFPNTNQLYFST